jgi:hypothetical protein
MYINKRFRRLLKRWGVEYSEGRVQMLARRGSLGLFDGIAVRA